MDSDAFIGKMKEIAASSGGSVQVLEPSGRRTQPTELSFTILAWPSTLETAEPFLSTGVMIDGITYGFHAYRHPTANSYSQFWLYFVVTGPGNNDGVNGEFHLTDHLGWIDERAWNPLVVKAALREWMIRPEVAEAFRLAKLSLPKPANSLEIQP